MKAVVEMTRSVALRRMALRTKPTRKTGMKRDDMRDERADTEAVVSTAGKREGESREQQ